MPPRPKTAPVHRSVEAAIRLGLIIGMALSGVAVAWLLVANRLPAFDRLAMPRNLAAVAIATILLLIPIYRFRRHPSHALSCGLTAWAILTLIYAILQIPFPRLATRLGTFHFFILGAILLALASAVLWVTAQALMCWHGPVVPRRRRAH
jgi:hypothetical protein